MHQRIRAFAADPRKQSVVFNNENFKSTFVGRIQGESLPERDFRAFLTVAKYYREHLHPAVPVVFVSEMASARGITRPYLLTKKK